MLVRELSPGILIEPIEGIEWILIPWRGVDGEISGKYISTSIHRGDAHHSWITYIGSDPLLYIGPLDRTSDGDIHTPGRQLVLYNGQALSVDPNCWRFLRPRSKS